MKKDSPGSVAYLQFLRLQRAANDTSGWTPLFDQLEYRLTDEGCGEWLLELQDTLINTGTAGCLPWASGAGAHPPR